MTKEARPATEASFLRMLSPLEASARATRKMASPANCMTRGFMSLMRASWKMAQLLAIITEFGFWEM